MLLCHSKFFVSNLTRHFTNFVGQGSSDDDDGDLSGGDNLESRYRRRAEFMLAADEDEERGEQIFLILRLRALTFTTFILSVK